MRFSASLRTLTAALTLGFVAASSAQAGTGLVAKVKGAPVIGSTAAATPAIASTYIDVSLAGWQSAGDFGDPGNTQTFLSIGAGSTVTGWSFTGLTFTTLGASYLSEFVISVNNADASAWLDATVSDVDASGSFGPADGGFDTAPLFAGTPFTVADGQLWITVYELYDDTGTDALVNVGTLRIYYDTVTAVPEPSTYGLMALGLFAVGAAARRRKA